MTSFEIALAQKPTPSFRVTYSKGNQSESYIVNAPNKEQAKMWAHLCATRAYGVGHYAGWNCKVSAYKGGVIRSTTTDLR
jgi:hypothetical protein